MKVFSKVALRAALFAFICLIGNLEASPTLVSGTLPGKDEYLIASNNFLILTNNYQAEWQYNRNGNTNEPPKLGLALCGGGMRAAQFSIGVLQGLHQLGVLKNIDVISSVSGGGYAASWLYIQSLNNDFNEESLFNDYGKYQHYLTNHGELISHFAATPNITQKILRRYGYVVKTVENCVTIPVNAFANGIFGWHANTVPGRRMYEEGIDRLFNVDPNADGKRSDLDVVGFRDFSPFINMPKHITFQGIASSNIQGRLPFPIVNTTAHVDAAPPEDAGLLQNRVFEFTPLHYGNDYFGYFSTNYPFDYNRAIAVSGGAFDSKLIRDPNESLLASIFNYDLGYSIDNPDRHFFHINAGSTKRIVTPRQKDTLLADNVHTYRYSYDPLPIPFYLFDGHYQKDNNGDRIYLSDGGHSENFGAYSLVRRLCKTIIIVDDEYDETNDLFDAYRRLKRALRSEMGVDFSVTNIDQGLCSLYNQTNPVMHGSISYFPVLNSANNAIEKRTIDIIYVLLSMNTNQLGSYPGVIPNYYNTTRGKTSGLQLSEFPMESTRDLSYYPEQVLAYHELGNYIITNNAKEFDSFRNTN
jgi:Patatin-like phospholipase